MRFRLEPKSSTLDDLELRQIFSEFLRYVSCLRGNSS